MIEIETAIKQLATGLGQIKGDIKPDDALKFTQAALNLAHAHAMLVQTKYNYFPPIGKKP